MIVGFRNIGIVCRLPPPRNSRKIFSAKITFSQNHCFSYRKSMILEVIFALFALLRKSAKSCSFLAQVENSEKHCRFTMFFGPFPHFCAKVGGGLILGAAGGGNKRTHGGREGPGGVRCWGRPGGGGALPHAPRLRRARHGSSPCPFGRLRPSHSNNITKAGFSQLLATESRPAEVPWRGLSKNL